MIRPFRFSVGGGEPVSAKALAEKARRAESIGYSAFVLSDHLLNVHAPIPALAAIAATTETLRIGMFVLNNDLRHPAVLAQELASLDILSEGRLEIGIGAGWNEPEYKASGIPFEPVPTRVSRLEESIAVLKGLFGDEKFSFQGTHYTITEMDGRPKPVQKPHPPILIGGGGKRVLRLAGREAQIVGFAPRIGAKGGGFESCTFEATLEKVQWVKDAAGPRFGDIELNTYPSFRPASVTDEPRKAAEALLARMKERSPVDITVDQLLDSPHVFIGTVDQLVEKFTRLRTELGISNIMVGSGMDDFAPVVERLAGR
ncbi:MAG TPA: TIGR03621 family F420-dependent LLM class oxidoreductase [Candidatus Limnocylindria bacterium]|nr:TIGR03621 family F420-dependent LLM class oxidoreductase [Candidatus Limnocylindria bacterium]